MMGEQAVESGDADIEVTLDGRTEELGGDGSLFGNREIAGAGAENGYGSSRSRMRCRLPQGGGARSGVEFCSGNARGDGLPCGIADAGGEHVGASRRGAGEDLGDVLRRFSFRVDDLGDAEAQAAVMIDPGKARVFIGHGAEALKRRLGRERAGAHGFEQCEHVVSIH